MYNNLNKNSYGFLIQINNFFVDVAWKKLIISWEHTSEYFKCIYFTVRSFGTEDRPTERPVAPRDEVYEYIIFRASDIKDLHVCEPPKTSQTLNSGLPNDPAIVQVFITVLQLSVLFINTIY